MCMTQGADSAAGDTPLGRRADGAGTSGLPRKACVLRSRRRVNQLGKVVNNLHKCTPTWIEHQPKRC